MEEPDIEKKVFEKLMSQEAMSVNLLKGGRNNKVHVISNMRGEKYILKSYFSSNEDNRDRMGNELKAYKLLNEYGLTSTPQLITYSSSKNCAIFTYIDGESGLANINKQNIRKCLDFMNSVTEIKAHNKYESYNLASEAVVNNLDILDHIQFRKEKLIKETKGTLYENDISEFIMTKLDTRLKALPKILNRAVLSKSQQVLSLCDFGFHNSVVSNNKIYFFDFEYFGWDDPTKLYSDFILHPSHNFNVEIKKLTLRAFLDSYNMKSDFYTRLENMYPYYAIKWALIILNVFTNIGKKRRAFSSTNQQDYLYLKQQLELAEKYLRTNYK